MAKREQGKKKRPVRFQMEPELYEHCEAMARKGGHEGIQALGHYAIMKEANRIQAMPTPEEEAKQERAIKMMRSTFEGTVDLGDFGKK